MSQRWGAPCEPTLSLFEPRVRSIRKFARMNSVPSPPPLHNTNINMLPLGMSSQCFGRFHLPSNLVMQHYCKLHPCGFCGVLSVHPKRSIEDTMQSAGYVKPDVEKSGHLFCSACIDVVAANYLIRTSTTGTNGIIACWQRKKLWKLASQRQRLHLILVFLAEEVKK